MQKVRQQLVININDQLTVRLQIALCQFSLICFKAYLILNFIIICCFLFLPYLTQYLTILFKLLVQWNANP